LEVATCTLYKVALPTAVQDNVGFALPTDEPSTGLRIVGAAVGVAAMAEPAWTVSNEIAMARAKPRRGNC
jgi:hypothetical protein